MYNMTLIHHDMSFKASALLMPYQYLENKSWW